MELILFFMLISGIHFYHSTKVSIFVQLFTFTKSVIYLIEQFGKSKQTDELYRLNRLLQFTRAVIYPPRQDIAYGWGGRKELYDFTTAALSENTRLVK